MITRSSLRLETPHWQKLLSGAINTPEALCERLNLDQNQLSEAISAAKQFPLKVTEHYLNLIAPGEPNDPLLRQILPIAAELETHANFVIDPVGDKAAACGDSILQKYQGRALLITTGACAIHCRYCFRRHYPYNEDNSIKHWPQMLHRLSKMHDVSEVILSGGDPLSLSDHRLQQLVQALEDLPHIKRLRIHSRLPVVLPQRITDELCQYLADSRLDCSLVVHANHPNEIDTVFTEHMRSLKQHGITLLNQSVLLSGVNDDVEILCDLSESLFAAGILPYYVHLLDKVSGAAHFAVAEGLADTLQRKMLERLPGYLVPRFVQEQAGAKSKTPIQYL